MLVRPSRSTFDAAVAADEEVTFFGATCDKALPAAALEDLPVVLLVSTVEAAFAACTPVVFATALLVVADCARAAKLFFATTPPLDFAVALWIRDAALGVIGVLPFPLPLVAMSLSFFIEIVYLLLFLLWFN